jgi:hypothetical protein
MSGVREVGSRYMSDRVFECARRAQIELAVYGCSSIKLSQYHFSSIGGIL